MSEALINLPQIDVITYLSIMAVCLIASALSGMSGMGGGVIISIFIAPIVGVEAVVPLLSVSMLMANGARVWVYFKALNWGMALRLALTSIPGVIVGALFYANTDTQNVSFVLGAVLILSVPLRRWLNKRKIYVNNATLVAFGFPYGVIGGTSIGAGMLIVPMLLGAGLAGPALLATDAMVAIGMNLAKIVVFGQYSALDMELLALGVLMGACTVPGTWIAGWIMARTDLRIHTVIMEVIVVIGGANFIFQALPG